MVNARAVYAVLLGGLFACIAWACLPDHRSVSSRYESLDAGNGQGGAFTPPPPSVDGGCWDPVGFGGVECFRCRPTKNHELLNACTTSSFERFDNGTRISAAWEEVSDAGFDALAPLQGEDAGGTSPPPAAECPITSAPNPVMVLGATGFPMKDLARAMGSAATIFYAEKGSCEGVASVVRASPQLSGPIVYFTASGPQPCVLATPQPTDIALSALFADTCRGQFGLPLENVLPPDVGDFLGPVSVIMFAVPQSSTQRAISAEASYRVYGFGSASGVAPWEDEQFIFKRRPSSGNQTVMSRVLRLPNDLFRGRDSNGSTNMLNALVGSQQPEKTLGISSGEIVDPNRNSVRVLAYQHYNQGVAFYPDSRANGNDRRNVRDGHYFPWAPLHVLTRTSGGLPIAAPNSELDPTGSKRDDRNRAVRDLTYVMSSRQDAPNRTVNLFDALKTIGNVPQCAMRVTRRSDGADLEPEDSSSAARPHCGCAWEEAGIGSNDPSRAACKKCSSDAECSSPMRCAFGYCEN